jgi:hypothetical protein
MPVEQKADERARGAARQRTRRASWSGAERAQQLKAHRERESRRRAAMTAEQRQIERVAKRDRAFCKKYGMQPGDWGRLFEAQGRRCACCGVANARWHTDHDHATGAVRGIVCVRCNIRLGIMGDTAETVRTVAQLLLRYLGAPC